MDRSLLPETAQLSLPRAIPIEFAVIHCSGFLALPWVARWTNPVKRLWYALALMGGYSLALGSVSLAVGGVWPLAIFWGLMFNRMLAVVLGDLPDDEAFTAWTMSWAGTTTLFVLAVLPAIFARGTVAQAVLLGFVYFTLVGLSELTGWAWVHRWMHNARNRARSAAGRR